MPIRSGTPATRAKNKYNDKAYDKFLLMFPKGEKDKHKAVLGKGEKVTLLLFEIIES